MATISDAGASELARVILRLAVGGTMIAHGARHGRTLDGTSRWFRSIGFRQEKLQAAMSAAVEIGAGGALLLGLATPLSAAAVVGTMAVAYRTVHRPNGYFVIDEGWEYVGIIGAASVALSALGSGSLSVDRRLGIDRIGSAYSRAGLSMALGAAGAAVQLKAFWSEPSAS